MSNLLASLLRRCRLISARFPGFVLLLFLGLLAGKAVVARAQPAASTEERRLEFAEASIGHEEAERTVQRAIELQASGLISDSELEAEEARLRLAELQMRRAWLTLVLADPEVVLREARKYQDQSGGVRVELDVVARWSFGAETSVQDGGTSSVELPAVEGVSNVVVSLKTPREYREGVLVEPTIVSVPYEHRVPLLRFDEPATIDFGLLVADVQELLVEFRYNNSVYGRQVLLGKRANEQGPVIIRSDQITLDAELGGEAVFDLRLERFEGDSATYGLGLEDLPAEVAFQFADPDTGAAFSQLFFPEAVTDRDLRLTLTMPSRPTADVRPDRALRFTVLVEPELGDGREAGRTAAGELNLAVVPRGIAELQIEAENLYHEVAPGDELQFDVRVVNSGSRTLEQVELALGVPFGWETRLAPGLFPSLEPGAEGMSVVTLRTPPDVILGDYEGTIRAGSLAGDRLLRSEERTLRLHVVASDNPWLVATLLVAALLVLAAVIWASIRLSRR